MQVVLSVVVPVYNEEATIEPFLRQLLERAGARTEVEILVVDGGSSDATVAMVEACGLTCLCGPRGRAQQMNFAAAQAKGDCLLFLHCDTALPENFGCFCLQVRTISSGWGFFKLRLSGRQWAFRVIERAISWRSRLTGIATGDQAIFVSRDLWQQVQGYRPLALMEDVDLSKRLRSIANPSVVDSAVVTSSRRWEQRGTLKTILLMWYLRLCFSVGVNDGTLARWYK